MKLLTGLLLGILLTFSSVVAESTEPTKPAQQDKCPVCGMFVAKYPDFVALILFKDGSRAFFDGVKDMFKYYFQIPKYNPSKRVSDIESIYVTDYYEVKPIDGLKAFYVLGSNVYGPMGKELIPFEKEADAMEFMVDHVGKEMLKFDAITPSTIEALD